MTGTARATITDRQRYRQLNRRGTSLLEMMIALSLTALVGLMTSLLYVQSLRVQKAGLREATSRDATALAMERIRPLIRSAYNLEYPGPDVLVLTNIAYGSDRRPKIDPTTKTLVSGEHVAIYRSDDKGAIEEYYETVDDGDGGTEEVAAYRGASGGDSLWTVARASSADAWGTPELLASGISSLEFSVATDLEGYAIADLIYVTLSVQQSSGSNTESWTTTTAVAVGNH